MSVSVFIDYMRIIGFQFPIILTFRQLLLFFMLKYSDINFYLASQHVKSKIIKYFCFLSTGLSLFDTLYLVVGIGIFGLPEIFSEWYMNQVNVYIMPIGYGLAHIGRVGSVFITVSVTIERYLAIVHPLQHFRGKKYLLYIPTIMTVIYNIPKFFEFETKVCLELQSVFLCEILNYDL